MGDFRDNAAPRKPLLHRVRAHTNTLTRNRAPLEIFSCHGNDRCGSCREDVSAVSSSVWSCCMTSRSVSVYCLFSQSYLLGIIISICGNALISISLNLQVGLKHPAWINGCKDPFLHLKKCEAVFCPHSWLCVHQDFSKHTCVLYWHVHIRLCSIQ